MDFGVFDHLDRYDAPLHEFYENRLRLAEEYDRSGFYAYHLAEHHSTPLGMAASPSVFLAALAQRTRRLRFGPLVYALPLYHPLRVIEEICMLDQLSAGRLDVGFGRGSSPIELQYFGINPEDAQKIYSEGVQLIVKGLTSKSLTFKGKYFNIENVRMELQPHQRPHPPIWYGVHSPDSAERAADQALNAVSLDPVSEMRVAFDRYRAVWNRKNGSVPPPKLGMGRFMVVADTDDEAVALGRRAYAKWLDSFTFLSRLHNRPQVYPRPETFDKLVGTEQGIAGSPATVCNALRTQVDATGANYIVCQFTFGDMTFSEALRSITLFARDVAPELNISKNVPVIASDA
jgi:alkanesulfonate monooxygenase SsuD/methylene tetrahydromethanopterin reductase-like flavin-dependent oxidoreductase (luciferase family)